MRPKLEDYFMGIAVKAAERGTCDKKRAGAIIVKDKYIIATGYNGSISGAEHCDDIGHDIVNERCIRTVHAEANAIANAAKHGAITEGTDMYSTHFPCWDCFKLAVNAGVKRFYYSQKPAILHEHYKKVYENAEKLKIPLIEISVKGTSS